jgi:arginase
MSNRFILTPYFLDQPMPGLELLLDDHWEVNKPPLPNGSPQIRMGELYDPLAEQIAILVSQGYRPVSVAGDCCTSLAVLAGLQRAGMNPTLIWFDAHGDFNTWDTTPSGFLGGMPLAILVGRGEQTIVERLELRTIPEERVILSDGRDLDPAESEVLAASQVNHLPQVMSLLEIDLGDGPLWVHFDTDLIDANEAPSMNYPVAGGPSKAQLQRIFSTLAGNGQICAVSISTWNPELDTDGRSQAVSMELLFELIKNTS